MNPMTSNTDTKAKPPMVLARPEDTADYGRNSDGMRLPPTIAGGQADGRGFVGSSDQNFETKTSVFFRVSYHLYGESSATRYFLCQEIIIHVSCFTALFSFTITVVVGLIASAVPTGSRKDRGRSGVGENGTNSQLPNGEIVDPMLIHPLARACTCCNNTSSDNIFNQEEMEEEVRYYQ